MRKILTLVLVFVFIFAFAACSAAPQSEDTPELPVQESTEVAGQTQAPEVQPEETAPIQTQKPAEAETAQMETLLAEYVDFSHYENRQGIYYLQNDFRPDYSAWNPASGYITIDGHVKVTTEETKVSDLLAQGWSFAEAEMEAYELGAMQTISSPSLYKNDKEIRVGLANPTEEPVKWTDAYISYIVLQQRDKGKDGLPKLAEATAFDIDGVLNQDSGLADIIQALGEPESIMCVSKDQRSYMDISYGPLEFKVSVDGTQIVEFSWF